MEAIHQVQWAMANILVSQQGNIRNWVFFKKLNNNNIDSKSHLFIWKLISCLIRALLEVVR